MGSRSVGKSSIVARYIVGPNEEIDSYHPTIESVKQKTLEWAGRNWILDVVDTAGQVSFRRQLRSVWFRRKGERGERRKRGREDEEQGREGGGFASESGRTGGVQIC